MKKTLLVIDMQNDFIDQALGTSEAQEIVDNVIDTIKDRKDRGYEIIATQDTHQENYLETLEGKNLPVEHCIQGTTGWEFAPGIKELLVDEIVFEKPTFGSEKLIDYLKENPSEEIELLGLCTDICVLSNAILLRAAFPNTPVKVIENCTAGVTPELKESALNVMQSCQIERI